MLNKIILAGVFAVSAAAFATGTDHAAPAADAHGQAPAATDTVKADTAAAAKTEKVEKHAKAKGEKKTPKAK